MCYQYKHHRDGEGWLELCLRHERMEDDDRMSAMPMEQGFEVQSASSRTVIGSMHLRP